MQNLRAWRWNFKVKREEILREGAGMCFSPPEMPDATGWWPQAHGQKYLATDETWIKHGFSKEGCENEEQEFFSDWVGVQPESPRPLR